MRILAPDDFPPLLREIPDAPETLYLRGTLPPKDHRLLAVVGSRRMSQYGKEACEHIIQGLRGYPVCIVSGLALGIDGVAHRAALAATLHTVAVPGSGLHDAVLYPRAHVRLAHDILESGGALLSEEAPDFHARPESFPKRNRIMAGMSNAVLVIEAGVQSGTLITARLATEYNRDVMTVPGSLFADNTAGPHLLLSMGALPVRSAEDIIRWFGFEETHIQETVTLTDTEAEVMTLLHEPKARDEVIRGLKGAVSEKNALLLKMELKGLIKEELGMIRKR